MKLLTLSKAVVPHIRIRYFSNRNILKTLCEKVVVQDVRYFSNRNILKTLGEKGMVQDVFPSDSETEIANLLSTAPRCLYAGFDPTADSLHVGNLLILMGLIHAQRAGHSVVALIGGATGRIGDPSGKNVERPEISQQVLDNNLNGIKRDIVNIFQNHEKYFWTAGKNLDTLPPLQIVNNEVFYKDMNIIDFLSTVGRHFRLGRMLSRQSVKTRMESDQGLSLTEFAYQTFQAYDWLQLYREKECLVQLGGSDQMGNLAAGQELISRVTDKQVYGVTLPLVVSESGEKLGKSSGAPVWLNPAKTSPFSFYQYFVRLPDTKMQQMLTFFTFLHAKEIEKLMEKHRSAPETRLAQQKLASCLTLLVHGQDGLDMARKTTEILYANDINKLASLSLQETRKVFEGAAYIQRLFQPGMTVLEMAEKVGCFRTHKDAVRIISAGGFYINMVRVDDTEEVVVPGIHIMDNQLTVLRVGKKNYYIVEWT